MRRTVESDSFRLPAIRNTSFASPDGYNGPQRCIEDGYFTSAVHWLVNLSTDVSFSARRHARGCWEGIVRLSIPDDLPVTSFVFDRKILLECGRLPEIGL